MITDNFTIFSGALSAAGVLSGQAVGGAASVVSTNSYDTGPRSLGNNQPVDFGQGGPVEFMIQTLVAPATPTAVEFQIVQADDGALTSNVEVLVSSGAIPVASLVAGAIQFLTPDSNLRASKRYIGVRYVITGTNTTSGTFFASIVAGKQDKLTAYRSGYAVS
jgi:hypothetical protein